MIFDYKKFNKVNTADRYAPADFFVSYANGEVFMNLKWFGILKVTRSKGKRHYILSRAIWLAIAGIIYSTFHYVFTKDYSNFISYFKGTIGYISVFFIVGLILGLILWELPQNNSNG